MCISVHVQVGQTACTACPENTESVPPANALEDCRCKKGYYSPVYDDTLTYGMPGFACVACNTADFAMKLGCEIASLVGLTANCFFAAEAVAG